MRSDSAAAVIEMFQRVRGSGPAKPVWIVTHERPDGDAVASSAGLARLLRENGFEAEFYLPGENAIPDCYRGFAAGYRDSVPGGDFCRYVNEHASLLVNVDASTVKRMNLGGADFAAVTVPTVTIDHHPDDTCFAGVNYVDPAACSTAHAISDLAETAGWTMSADTATTLLLGVISDSGCFRFDNTSAAAMRAAARLLEAGADHHRIVKKVYLSKPMNMAMFEAEMLCRCMRTALNGRFAWFTLDAALMKRYGVDLRNTEQLVDVIRAIDGVTVSALIKPVDGEPGAYKISLRSKDPAVSVGRIARTLNGGGHEMAAGGTIYASSPEEAEMILTEHVEQEFHEKQSE